MIPAEFDYRRPASVEEALDLLSDNPGATLLAGGHSLIPMMKLRVAAPSMLVDLGGIDELAGITTDGDDLVVGAMATHHEIATSDEVRGAHPGLAEAAASIGDAQVRNCGTLGGSLAHADPSADYPAAVRALDAEIVVTGGDGERTIPSGEFFGGLFTTAVEPDEIISAVRFPGGGRGASAYEKFEQPASGFAIVGVCGWVEAEDGACAGARLGATGVSDRPVRLAALEERLVGSELAADRLGELCDGADDGLDDVREDQYASGDYRRHLLRVYARRVLERIV